LVGAFIRFYNNRTDQLRTSFSTHITTIFMFSICISLSVPDVDHCRRLNSCLPTAHHTTNYSADYTNCRAHHIYSHLSFLSGPLPQSVRWCCPHTSLTSPSPLLPTTVPITPNLAHIICTATIPSITPDLCQPAGADLSPHLTLQLSVLNPSTVCSGQSGLVSTGRHVDGVVSAVILSLLGCDADRFKGV
jgi:hypothetical protein